MCEVFVVDLCGFSVGSEEACVGFEFACGGEAEFSEEVVSESGAFSVVVEVVCVVHEVNFDSSAVVFWVEPDLAVFYVEFECIVYFIECVSVFDFVFVFGEFVVNGFEFGFGSVHSLYMVRWVLNSSVCVRVGWV